MRPLEIEDRAMRLWNDGLEKSATWRYVCKWIIVPLKQGTKRPMIAGWEKTTHEKSIQLVRELGGQCTGWGALTGRVNGIFVIDVDVKGKKENPYWVRLVAEHPAFETRTVRTGSGGLHYYFKYEDWMDNIPGTNQIKVDGVCVDIDLKTNGQQIVLDGSTHPDTGRSYVLEIDCEPEPMPEWLKQWILSNAGKIHIEVESPVAVLPSPVPSVNKDSINYEVIGQLLDALPESYATQYDLWRNVGFTLHTLPDKDLGLELYDQFSKRGGSTYKGFKDVWSVWRKIEDAREDLITIDSLWYWAKKENPVAYRQIKGEKIEAGIFGDMFLHDLRDKWVHSRTRSGIKESEKDELLQDVKKCIFYLDTFGKNEWFICDKPSGVIQSSFILPCKGDIVRLLDYKAPEVKGHGRPRKNEGYLDLGEFIWEHRAEFMGWHLPDHLSASRLANFKGPYLYLIYRENPQSATDFIGKVGRGTGDRYKHYTTPYGSGYDMALVSVNNAKDAEKDLLQWGRDQGLVHSGSEVLNIPLDTSKTVQELIDAYRAIYSKILERLRTYGPVWTGYVGKGKNITDLTSIDPPPTPDEEPETKEESPKSLTQSKEYHILFLEQYDWPQFGREYAWLKAQEVYGEYLTWHKKITNTDPIAYNWFIFRCNIDRPMLEHKRSMGLTLWRRLVE